MHYKMRLEVAWAVVTPPKIFCVQLQLSRELQLSKLTRDSCPNLHATGVETGKKHDAMHGFGFDGTDFYKHYRIWTSIPILLTLATHKV